MDVHSLIEIKERLARIEERQLLIKREGEQIHEAVHNIDKRVHHLEIFYHKLSGIVAVATVITSIVVSFFIDSIKNVFSK